MLEQLSSPPIVEVVCGFVFEPLGDLDPMLIGNYWAERRVDFPKRELQPPISDGPIVFGGAPPLRCWLISSDEAFLAQIQPDRFYLNWRRRNSDYPRFSDHPGKPPGILSRAISEFELFSNFCERELGKRPRVLSFDLAKIDHLVQGEHWGNLNELSRVIPWLQDFSSFAKADDPDFALRFSEVRGVRRIIVAIDSAVRLNSDETSTRVVKIETRVASIVAADARSGFESANHDLNQVFESLIPKEQRNERFSRS